jgi:hypothetical protein
MAICPESPAKRDLQSPNERHPVWSTLSNGRSLFHSGPIVIFIVVLRRILRSKKPSMRYDHAFRMDNDFFQARQPIFSHYMFTQRDVLKSTLGVAAAAASLPNLAQYACPKSGLETGYSVAMLVYQH